MSKGATHYKGCLCNETLMYTDLDSTQDLFIQIEQVPILYLASTRLFKNKILFYGWLSMILAGNKHFLVCLVLLDQWFICNFN